MSSDGASPPTPSKPVPWYHMVIGWVIILGLCGGLCGGGWLIARYVATGADYAKMNDCLAEDRGESPPYRRVSCDDDAATYRVLAVADWTPTGANPCVDVPGASRMFDTTRDNKIICIGDKNADPTKSINLAREGDCLRVVRDADAERLDCADPRANFEVLRRLVDAYLSDLDDLPASPSQGPCADVPATETRYGVQWRSDEVRPRAPRLPGKHFDLLFCLGRVHEPPPAVPNAAANCRFVAANDVLAAVNAVGGRRYRSAGPGWANGDAPCTYALSREEGGRDAVMIQMSGDFTWPPPDRQEFTLDGTKAAWRANTRGLGVGHLSVARPGGNFEITLSFVSSSYLREMAIEIYRAAAPHLP